MGKRYYYVGRAGMTVSIFTDSSGNDYLNAIKVDIDNTKVPSDLNDFPVALDIADIRTQLSTADADHFFNNVKSDGADIRVSKADQTTELPIEVESFDDTAETGAIWWNTAGVLSSSSDTTFYIWYNGTANAYAETDTYGRENVWNTAYMASYRMNNDPSGTAPQMIDSTSNNNDGTSHNSMTSGDLIDGQIGKALEYEQSSNQYISVDDDDTLSFGDGSNDSAFSIVVVAYHNSNYFYPVAKDASSNREYAFREVSGNARIFLLDNSSGGFIGRSYSTNLRNESLMNQWNLWVVTYNGSGTNGGLKIYLNGTQVDDADYSGGSYTAMENTGSELRIGSQESPSRFHDGKIDETRIVEAELSSDWVSTLNNNLMDSNNFYSLSKV